MIELKRTRFFSSFLFFISVVMVVGLLPLPAGAVSYYNVLDNPSFAQYTDYVYDGSFESGVENQTSTMGNWSMYPSDCQIYSGGHTGVYGLHTAPYFAGFSSHAKWDLEDDYEFLGADLVSATFWAYDSDGAEVYVRYTDASSDTDTYTTTGWEEVDFTSLIDVSKYVDYIWFADEDGDSAHLYMDDFSLLIDDGDAQDSINYYTSPWAWAGTYSNPFYSPEMVDDFGRIDDFSMMMYTDLTTRSIDQWIDYIDSDNIQFFSLYIYATSGEGTVGVTVRISYADGSTDTKTETITADSTWQYVNFGGSWIDSGKIIRHIRISPYGVTDNMWIDDVGLWSTVPVSYSKFEWLMSPSPKEVLSNQQAECWCNVAYTFYGYVYNATGVLNVNGTYTFTTGQGSTSGDVVMGEFNVTLSKRVSPQQEVFGIVIIDDDTDEVTVLTISIDWYANEGGVSTGDSDVFDSGLIRLFTIYMVIGLPALLLGIVTKNVMAMILGLTIGLASGYMAGMVDVWLVLLMGVAVVVLLFAGRPR